MQTPTIDMSSLRFVIADDSRFMRRLLTSALLAFGAGRIVETATAQETLDRIELKREDIVLLDWDFGDATGEWVMRQIRQPGHPRAFQTVIMVSPHDEQRWIERALLFGVNGYVTKPVSLGRLYGQIANAVLNPKPYVQTPDYFGPQNLLIAREMQQVDDAPAQTTEKADATKVVMI